MDLKPALLLLPVLVLPWIILLFVRASAKKKTIKNFRKLTENYGLESALSGSSVLKSLPSVKGVYRSRPVKVESFDKDPAGRKKSAPHTILTVECSNDSGFEFTVVKNNRHNAGTFGKNSVRSEDEEFDSKYIISSNDPAKIKRIFDFNTRFKLDQVHKLGFEGVIDLRGNFLFYSEKGLMKTDESLMRFELVLHELCDIADVMKYS
jgi:hypothetical protein